MHGSWVNFSMAVTPSLRLGTSFVFMLATYFDEVCVCVVCKIWLRWRFVLKAACIWSWCTTRVKPCPQYGNFLRLQGGEFTIKGVGSFWYGTRYDIRKIPLYIWFLPSSRYFAFVCFRFIEVFLDITCNSGFYVCSTHSWCTLSLISKGIWSRFSLLASTCKRLKMPGKQQHKLRLTHQKERKREMVFSNKSPSLQRRNTNKVLRNELMTWVET